jgi:hypothetical protein
MENNNNNTQFNTPLQNRQDRVFSEYEKLIAQVAQGGVTVETSALFDLQGNWTPARLVMGQYGYSWLVLDNNGKSTGVYVPYASKKRETQAKRGFVEGKVLVPAKAEMWGGKAMQTGLVPAHEIGTVKPTEIICTDRFTTSAN